MAHPLATDEHPAKLRAETTNTTVTDYVLGERPAVQGPHVTSQDGALYLMPVHDGKPTDLVEPGCWALTEHVAVTTEYGTVEGPAGESIASESFPYGHVDAEIDCLAAGDHRVGVGGRAAEDPPGLPGNDDDATEFSWGFTLNVQNG
jgi:hypothetical protein